MEKEKLPLGKDLIACWVLMIVGVLVTLVGGSVMNSLLAFTVGTLLMLSVVLYLFFSVLCH